MTDLPESVHQAHDALRTEDWALACDRIALALDQVAQPALRARLHGWRAQALTELGALAPARQAVRQALLAARDLGEQHSDATAPLRALHGRISARMAAQAAADQRRAHAADLAARPLDELLAAAAPGAERAAVYLARADALVDAGRPQGVPALITRGLAEAPLAATREQVLLRLALLRTRPANAADVLSQALELADDAASETLVTAVARAARDLALPLPEPGF